MKIVIGSDGKELHSSVAKRFGHAKYYLVYNSDTKEIESFENMDEDHSHSSLFNLLEQGTEAFIVTNIGPHAFEIVTSNNAKVFLTRGITVKETIESYTNGNLVELNEPTVKKSITHGHH